MQPRDGWVRKKFQVILNVTVGANGQAIPQLTMDGDADFELHEIIGNRTSALLTIEMFDAAAGGQAYQSAPVNIDNFLGTAQLPFVLVPQLWKKRQTISFRLVDTSGAPNVVQIAFSGYKLFPAAA